MNNTVSMSFVYGWLYVLDKFLEWNCRPQMCTAYVISSGIVKPERWYQFTLQCLITLGRLASTVLPHFLIFDNRINEKLLRVVLFDIFLVISKVEHFFTCLRTICVSFYVNHPYPCQFFYWVGFFPYWFVGSFFFFFNILGKLALCWWYELQKVGQMVF